jgi:hypothetical protein
MMKAGLLAACLGAVLLALSSHLGVVTGFVGTAVWATPGWRLANGIGWLFLVLGFFLHYLSVRRTPLSTWPVSKMEALLNVLERQGVIRKADVLEEITRLRETSVKAR